MSDYALQANPIYGVGLRFANPTYGNLTKGVCDGRHCGSQAKFTMRSETRELQRGVVIRFPVNQYQVGLDVAIPMVLPITGERMIAMPVGHSFI